MITYEYPLNERIRTLLRLEHLFDQAEHFVRREDAEDHHVALLTLFEILEVAGRADLKSDLLQELERQKHTLAGYRNNPDISEEALNSILADIERTTAALYKMTGKIGQYLRENEWLMSIKQRAGIPGGLCEFDLPSYHLWLHHDAAARGRALGDWIAPLLPIRDGVTIVLRLLRDSGRPVACVAANGSFQQMLGGRLAQMLRVRVKRDCAFIPEISANKYALNIRYTVQDGDLRPRMCEADVEFELTFCNI